MARMAAGNSRRQPAKAKTEGPGCSLMTVSVSTMWAVGMRQRTMAATQQTSLGPRCIPGNAGVRCGALFLSRPGVILRVGRGFFFSEKKSWLGEYDFAQQKKRLRNV